MSDEVKQRRTTEDRIGLARMNIANAFVSLLAEAIRNGPEAVSAALDAFDEVGEGGLVGYTQGLLDTLDRARESIGEPKAWTPAPLDKTANARIQLALSRLPREG